VYRKIHKTVQELLIVKTQRKNMLKELNLGSSDKIDVSHFEKQTNETNLLMKCNDEETQEMIEMSKLFAAIIYDNWVREQNRNVAEIETLQPLTKAA